MNQGLWKQRGRVACRETDFTFGSNPAMAKERCSSSPDLVEGLCIPKGLNPKAEHKHHRQHALREVYFYCVNSSAGMSCTYSRRVNAFVPHGLARRDTQSPGHGLLASFSLYLNDQNSHALPEFLGSLFWDFLELLHILFLLSPSLSPCVPGNIHKCQPRKLFNLFSLAAFFLSYVWNGHVRDAQWNY